MKGIIYTETRQGGSRTVWRAYEYVPTQNKPPTLFTIPYLAGAQELYAVHMLHVLSALCHSFHSFALRRKL